jgi:hypothetical protein
MSVACMGGLLLLRRHWRPQAVAWAWLAAALLSCAIAGVQYLGWAEHGAPWIAPIGPGEGSANLRQRNQFATFTAIGLIALSYLASTAHKRRPVAGWTILAAALAVALLAVGNAVTSSRTGALAWTAVLAADGAGSGRPFGDLPGAQGGPQGRPARALQRTGRAYRRLVCTPAARGKTRVLAG